MRRGFTIVEMMVSMAAGMLLLLGSLAVLEAGGRGYRRSSDGLAAEREARAALDLLARDLGKAIGSLSPTGSPGLTVERAGGQAGWRNDRIGFLALQPDDSQADGERLGDLCAVVYYLADQEMDGRSLRCLMRGLRPSAQVFAALRDGSTDALYRVEENDEPLVFGIVSFEAEPLRRGVDGLAPWSAQQTADPGAVRLRLVVARPALIGKLENAADWDDHPLLGVPAQAARSPWLEVFESHARCGHGG